MWAFSNWISHYKKRIIVVFFFLCFIAAYELNIDKFIPGRPPTHSGTISSIVLFMAWIIVGILLSRDYRWCLFSLCIISLSLIVGIINTIVIKFDLGASGLILFAILFLTPYYGFRAFCFLNNAWLYTAVLSALELMYVFLIIQVKQLRK